MTQNSWNSQNPAQVARGGTGLATITSHGFIFGNGTGNMTVTAEPTNGQIPIGKTGDFPQLATITAGTGISITNAAGSITVTNTSGALTNPVIQKVSANTTAFVDCATVMPFDDTIPTNAEGNEVITCAITPTNTNNILEIEFTTSFHSGPTSNTTTQCAIFQDATAAAKAAVSFNGVGDSSDLKSGIIRYRMVAGTVAATTFKVRVGNNSGTSTINGHSGARLWGGVASTYLTVTEYKV